MWRSRSMAAASVLGALAGCGPADSPDEHGSRRAGALTLEQLRNAEYRSQWPASGVARLVEGVYREPAAPGSATEIIVRATSAHAFGDLDADGAADAVIVLEADPGGSGVFFDLVPVLNRGGQPLPLAPTPLGDRVEVTSVTVARDGGVNVKMLMHAPDDPQCCPTLDVVLRYRLDGDRLVDEGQEDRKSVV